MVIKLELVWGKEEKTVQGWSELSALRSTEYVSKELYIKRIQLPAY